MVIIVANTVLMASEFYGMPVGMVQAYEIINYAVTAYFAVEMAVKIVGLKPRGYIADSFNVFDGTVVIISIVELALADGSGSLSVLRSCRLLRILKLARSWPQLRKIVATIMQTIPSMSSLAGMLFLFIFIFDLLGMQMFGYQFIFCDSYDVEGATPMCPPGVLSADCPKRRDCYAPCAAPQVDQWITFGSDGGGAGGLCSAFPGGGGGDGGGGGGAVAAATYMARLGRSDQPRHHFDDIFWGFVTIFQVLTGENWNEVMYDGMRTQGTAACIYFLLLVVIGNYIVLNLFLAILLDNFSGMDDDPEEVAVVAAAAATAAAGAAKKEEEIARRTEEEAARKKQRDANMGACTDPGASTQFNRPDRPMDTKLCSLSLATRAQNALNAFISLEVFDNTIMVVIVASSVLLAVDSPKVHPESRLKQVLNVLDTSFVVFFAAEAAVKIAALGRSYFTTSWNLMDFAIVIIGSVATALEAAGGDSRFAALRTLRAFRALRPLRVAVRNEGMKLVVSALFQAIPAIAHVALVCVLFYLVFGILGLNLFMGKMHRCEEVGGEVLAPLAFGIDEKLMTRQWCRAHTHVVGCIGASRASFFSAGGGGGADIGESGWSCAQDVAADVGVNTAYNRIERWGGQWTCTASSATAAVLNASNVQEMTDTYGILASACYAPRSHVAEVERSGVFVSSCTPMFLHTQWVLPRGYDYDNIGHSMLVLFETATLEMWPSIMYHSVDAVEEGFHPRFNHNPAACIFYVFFIIVGVFFVMNLFVGVTIDKFNQLKEAASKEKGEGASVFLTEAQRRWQQVEKMLAQTKPVKHYDVPTHPLRLAVFRVCTAPEFDAAVMALILVNVLVMSMSYAGESAAWADGLFWTNAVLTFVFTLEVIGKNVALGPRAYLEDAWNRFDISVVFLSIVGFVITVSTTTKARESYLALLRIPKP
jgi:uncharacterized membrane protein YgcG